MKDPKENSGKGNSGNLLQLFHQSFYGHNENRPYLKRKRTISKLLNDFYYRNIPQIDGIDGNKTIRLLRYF